MELGPEDVSLLERCPHFRGCVATSACVFSAFSSRKVPSMIFFSAFCHFRTVENSLWNGSSCPPCRCKVIKCTIHVEKCMHPCVYNYRILYTCTCTCTYGLKLRVGALAPLKEGFFTIDIGYVVTQFSKTFLDSEKGSQESEL